MSASNSPVGKSFDNLPNELRQKIFGYVIDAPLPATISETDCLPTSVRRNLPMFRTVLFGGRRREAPELNPSLQLSMYCKLLTTSTLPPPAKVISKASKACCRSTGAVEVL